MGKTFILIYNSISTTDSRNEAFNPLMCRLSTDLVTLICLQIPNFHFLIITALAHYVRSRQSNRQ